MPGQNPRNPLIIGVAGSFGSGCSYIAEYVLKDKEGYTFLSLSKDVLRPLFRKETGKDPDQVTRRELQDFGDKIREEKCPEFLAEETINRIKEGQAKNTNGKWVVDSIRNPAEIRALRRFSQNFFLFGVYAEKEIRWSRTERKYQGNRQEFDDNDRNDTGEDNPSHGQRVWDCFYEADIIVSNNKEISVVGNEQFVRFCGKIGQYVELTQKPLKRQQPIRKDESLMAMAYALSQRSSCRKRKVGAIIVDGEGNVISSGYNEVPKHEIHCTKEYKTCYRDWLSDKFFDSLKREIPQAEGKSSELKSMFRKQFKNLDYCRALHAEENAIVNLARNGRSVPLQECVLYTTTYPCRMCANKIVNVGLKHIVYVEPYPDEAVKLILENADVDARFFEGVTFKAYSRLYGEEK